MTWGKTWGLTSKSVRSGCQRFVRTQTMMPAGFDTATSRRRRFLACSATCPITKRASVDGKVISEPVVVIGLVSGLLEAQS